VGKAQAGNSGFSYGASYAGVGSGVVVDRDCVREIEE
jgi:hypothetical protein